MVSSHIMPLMVKLLEWPSITNCYQSWLVVHGKGLESMRCKERWFCIRRELKVWRVCVGMFGCPCLKDCRASLMPNSPASMNRKCEGKFWKFSFYLLEAFGIGWSLQPMLCSCSSDCPTGRFHHASMAHNLAMTCKYIFSLHLQWIIWSSGNLSWVFFFMFWWQLATVWAKKGKKSTK